MSGTSIEFPSVSFKTIVADTQTKRRQGLMYVEDLPSKNGMLFKFKSSEFHGFWMKNTPLSLDIVWIDEYYTVVDIIKDTVPFSTESLLPTQKARYALEINAGLCDLYKIKIGQKVKLLENTPRQI